MTFFDCILDRSELLNLFENYFYLDGISGKLGIRRLKQISISSSGITLLKDISNNTTPSTHKNILTAVKIASYFTLLIPLIMLTGKVIKRFFTYKKNLTFVLQSPPLSPEVVKNGQKLIQKLHTVYFPKAAYKHLQISHVSGYQFKHLRTDSIPASYATIHPDSAENDLVRNFINDPDVLFLTNKDGNEVNIQDPKSAFPYLQKMLTAAFNTDKKIVVARFSNTRHTYLAAFDHSGQFRIIDSLSQNTFDVKALESILNEANIKTKEGISITFKGKKDCLGIQKEGHMCVRFATLFAYQILKEKHIDAHKKVIGAFSEKLLNKFSNLPLIDQAKPLASGKEISVEAYSSFMKSWGSYICLGVDDWKEFSLNKLEKGSFVGIYPDQVPIGLNMEKDMENLTFYVKERVGTKTPLANYYLDIDLEKLKIGDVIPKDAGFTHYLYHSIDEQILRIAKVPSDREVIREFKLKNSNKPRVQNLDMFQN